jgi:hypothetical protein
VAHKDQPGISIRIDALRINQILKLPNSSGRWKLEVFLCEVF